MQSADVISLDRRVLFALQELNAGEQVQTKHRCRAGVHDQREFSSTLAHTVQCIKHLCSWQYRLSRKALLT